MQHFPMELSVLSQENNSQPRASMCGYMLHFIIRTGELTVSSSTLADVPADVEKGGAALLALSR